MKLINLIIGLSFAFLLCFSIYSQNNLCSVSLISKQKLFNKSKESFSKVKAVFSVGAGVSFLADKGSSPLEDFKPKYSFQLLTFVPLGKYSGLRLDMSYSNWFRDNYRVVNSFYGTVVSDSYGAQTKHCYYLKTDLVLGSILLPNQFWFCMIAGFGMNLVSDGGYLYEHTEEDTVINEFKSLTRTYSPNNRSGAILSVGSTIGYKFTKQLGVYTDVQFNIAAGSGYSFFGKNNESYIPVRTGITYTVY